MADYDWFSHSGPYKYECCRSDMWHKDSCENHPKFGEQNKKVNARLARLRAEGIVHMQGDLWACRRGCGCVVHDPETHIKNVCIEFNPVVGHADA